jgi:hypothetical protein
MCSTRNQINSPLHFAAWLPQPCSLSRSRSHHHTPDTHQTGSKWCEGSVLHLRRTISGAKWYKGTVLHLRRTKSGAKWCVGESTVRLCGGWRHFHNLPQRLAFGRQYGSLPNNMVLLPNFRFWGPPPPEAFGRNYVVAPKKMGGFP